MTQQTHIKISGVWKPVRIIWEKVSGSWKYHVVSKMNVASVWKTCQSYTALPGEIPYIQGGSNTGTVPSGGGWTGYTYPIINTSASTPFKCTALSSISMTAGNGTTSFYVGLQGIHTTQQMCAATADIRLTIVHPIYGTETNIISSSLSLLNTAKVQVNVDLSSWDWGLHGTSWRTDDVGTVTIENITYGAYAACV